MTSRRIEHYHDPGAPKPNSLIPAASAVAEDGQGRILLQLRRDNQLWALPGGTMEFGETIEQTTTREVKEETGFEVEIVGLIGIYTDPDHRIEYSDGEVRQQFNICFAARIVGGRMSISDESSDLRFVARDELDILPIHESTRLRIRHYLEDRDQPYLG